MNPTKPNIDLKATTPLYSEDGNLIFSEGIVFRKVSRFLTGTTEDALIPIPVFYDIKSGRILLDTLPKELKEEYAKLNETNAEK